MEAATSLAIQSDSEQVGAETLDAFAVLAMQGGNLAATERLTGIPDATLCDWRQRYPEVYAGIARRIQAQLEKRVELKAGEVAFNAIEGTDELINEVRKRLEDGDIKDPAGAALRLATIFGITTDKSQLLQGKPTSIHANVQTAEEDLTYLKQLIQDE